MESDRRFIKQARKEVETLAHKMLEQGMESQVSKTVLAQTFENFLKDSFELRHFKFQKLLNSKLIKFKVEP